MACLNAQHWIAPVILGTPSVSMVDKKEIPLQREKRSHLMRIYLPIATSRSAASSRSTSSAVL
jgi:hypothetical protein